jgi:hypothetical protein
MEEMQRLWKKWQAMSVKSMVTDKKVENLRNALEGINLFERASVHPFHQPLLYLTQGILGLRTHPIEEKLTLHKQRAAAMRMFFREISPVMSQATNPEDPYTLTSLARAWGLVNVLEPPPPKGNFRVPPKSNVKPPEEVFDAVKAFDLLFHTQRAECMARWQAWLPWANKRKLQQLQQVNATMAGTLQAMLEVAPFYYPIDSRYIHNFRDRPFPYWLRVRSDLTHLLQPVQRHPQHFNWPNVLKTGEAYWTPALLQQLSPADFSALSPDLQCKLTAWVAQQKTSGAWEGKRPAWFPSTKPPQGSP